MKNALSILLACTTSICFSFFLVSTNAFAQLSREHGHFTPGGIFDTVFDDHGHKYALAEFSTNDAIRATATGTRTVAHLVTPGSACGTPGYFKLFLDPASGLIDPATMLPGATGTVYDDRLQVLCQVLKDVSAFINSPLNTTGKKVNVWVKPSLTAGSFLGLAYGVYSMPQSSTKSGIVDNAAWITINSGHDAFDNIGSLYTSGTAATGSTFFHIVIQFDFSGLYSWNTNMAAAPAPSQYDLYSVFLHEILHSLGFMSLIGLDGRSVFDYSNPYTPFPNKNYQYYSRYDKNIQTQSGNKLITSAAGSCNTDMYQFGFNSSAGTPSMLIAPVTGAPCAGVTNVPSMASSLLYAGSTMQYVYTPGCYASASSLSHLDDEFTTYLPGVTAYDYFVMGYAIPPGIMRRYPKPGEQKVLCDLGYSTNTTFGVASGINLNYINYGAGSACAAPGVAGINDGLNGGAYSYVSTGGAITINANDLLSNDYGVGPSASPTGSVSCVEVVNGTGTVFPATVAAGGSFTYTPALTDNGVIILRYLPKSATGAIGNITYVYVFVGPAGCTATACNMISNGDFENTTAGFYGTPGWGANVSCWTMYDNTSVVTGMYSRGAANAFYGIPSTLYVPNVHPDPLLFPAGPVHNDHFAAFWFQTPTSGLPGPPYQVDALSQSLSTPIVAGNSYTISFWAFVSNNVSQDPITFAISNGPVFIPNMTSSLPAGLTSLADITLLPGVIWRKYSVTVVAPVSGTQITIMPAPWPLILPYWYGITAAIDDISIVPAPVCPFTIPPMCYNNAPVDLNTFTCGAAGTFAWQTMVAGAPATTTSNMFDPNAAYAASEVLVDTGNAYVAYDYTNSMGCPVHVVSTVQLFKSTPAIAGPGAICTGTTITFSDSLSGGTWASSVPSVAAIHSSTGVVTGLTPGSTVISYAGACGTVTSNLTVNAGPGVITGVAPICQGAAITLGGVTAGGSWTSAAPSIATVSATGNVTGISNGVTIITYQTGTYCYTTATVTVSGNAAIATYSYSAYPPHPGLDTVSFTYTGSVAIDSMRWDFGDGGTSGATNPIHAFVMPPDSFNVCLIVYGPCGNDTFCSWVHPNTCVLPIASFIDTGTSVIGFVFNGMGAIDSMRWDFGDGSTSGASNPTHIFSTPPDSFNVCLKAYGPCGNDTFCSWVYPDTCVLPVASFTDTGTNIKGYTYTGTGAVDSILWDFGDGQTSMATTPVHTYTTQGTYHVCVTVYTPCGSDSGCRNIVVTSLGVASLGHAQHEIEVWPNPVKDELVVMNAADCRLTLCDVVGHFVKFAANGSVLSTSREVIDLAQLPKGIYIVQIVNTTTGYKVVRKIAKE